MSDRWPIQPFENVHANRGNCASKGERSFLSGICFDAIVETVEYTARTIGRRSV